MTTFSVVASDQFQTSSLRSSAAVSLAAAARRARADFVPKDGKIGYAMTDLYWAIYQTPDAKQECPKGFNDGPREQFDKLFPAGKKRTVADTQLHARDEDVAHVA